LKRGNKIAAAQFRNKEVEMKNLLGIFVLVVGIMSSCFAAGSGSAGSSGQPVVKPESPAVTAYNEGVSLMKAKQFARAQVKFEQAVKQEPGFAEAHNNLAFCLRKQGSQNFQKSLAHYDKAISLKPKLAVAYEYRGVLYMQLGRKADAEKDLATLKKLNPHLAGELETYIKTGKEDDDLYEAKTN
jgi:tetratricopeptide (TPR) repeat protein